MTKQGQGTRVKGQDEQLDPVHVSPPVIHTQGLVDYQPTWDAMKKFTAERNSETCDEIWLVQHPPVYTQGLAGKPEHLLHSTGIPVIKIDRGGQITYHGPGQIVAYMLLDLRRWKINVRELVRLMEQAVIDLLAEFGIAAQGREEAPGVYVGDAKIADSRSRTDIVITACHSMSTWIWIRSPTSTRAAMPG
jgi:lipoate-protein ligase B